MDYEWDAAKALANLAKHEVAFEAVEGFDWTVAVEVVDDRADYGEVRMIAYAPIAGRLHVLVYTPRGARVRVISLRKANSTEQRYYRDAQ